MMIEEGSMRQKAPAPKEHLPALACSDVERQPLKCQAPVHPVAAKGCKALGAHGGAGSLALGTFRLGFCSSLVHYHVLVLVDTIAPPAPRRFRRPN